MIALVVAVSLSAFSSKHLFKHKLTETFVYIGTNTADQDQENSYVLLSTNPEVSCGGREDVICQLEATPNAGGQHPDFSVYNPVDDPTEFTIISKRPL